MTVTSKTKKKSSLMSIRKGMLWFSMIATFLIGLRHLLPGEAASGGSFDAFCPFGAIENLVPYFILGKTLKTTNLLNFTVFSGVLMVSFVAGRAFCGWMCPLGAVQELLANVSRRVGGERKKTRGKVSKTRFPLKLPGWTSHPTRYIKYLVLAFVILASAATIYPPLHNLCPARAVFSFKFTSGLLWGILVTFIITSLLVDRFSCKFLCPLGAALSFSNKISPVRLSSDSEVCNHCKRCDTECSMGIQDVPDNLSHPECIRCLECLETCTRDEALTLRVVKP